MSDDFKKKIYELGRLAHNDRITIDDKLKIVNDNYIQAPNDCDEVYTGVNNDLCRYEHGCSWKIYDGKDTYCMRDWWTK